MEGIIEVDSSIPLTPFIETASSLVDIIEEKDSSDELTSARLELIERWLAAHFYSIRDPRTIEEHAGPVGARYEQGSPGKRLEATKYGQQAIALDSTGTLVRISAGKLKATVTWLGTAYE